MIVRDRREKTAKRAGALSRPGPVELLFFVLLFGLDDLFGLGDLDVYDGLVLGYILVVYVVRLDYDLGAVGNLALEDHLAHRVLDHALKDALKGPRAERRIVASVGELVQSLARELYGHLAIGELLAQAPYLDLDDVAHVLALELVEDDGLVDPVEKLGTEDLTKLRRDSSLHLLVGEPSLVVTEAQRLGLVDVLGADVRGHDEDHVLEVHSPALRVGELPVFQDLQEDIEDVWVSSVFPTPVGPRKTNEPLGRFGSLRPAMVRRMERETALMASFCPTTRSCSSSSIFRSFSVSSSVIFLTGMPVHMETISAISFSPMEACASPSPPSRQFCSSSRRCKASLRSLSRSRAAFSNSCPSIAASFWDRTSLSSSSISL